VVSELSKALGLERQRREVARELRGVEQLLRFFSGELSDWRATERDRRQIVGKIERTDASTHRHHGRVGRDGCGRRDAERES
jgi:hypothetical protein